MKWAVIFVILFAGGYAAQAEENSLRTYNFDADRVGEAPAGFSLYRTGDGRVGRWIIQTEKNAPSGSNIVTQADTDAADYRFPLAVASEPVIRNFRLSVWCKPVSGQVDQAAGLVFRYQDENNYYVTRANALEDNVRLYKVVHGRRQQFAGWNGRVTRNVWHELRVEAEGDHFEVYWDDQKIINAHDKTFPGAGKIGLWTKADSVTYFDDLAVFPSTPAGSVRSVPDRS